MTDVYLGMRPGDLDGKPYARFWNPDMAPLPARAREAVAVGPIPAPLLDELDGYGRTDDGGIAVAITTDMPGVAPEMIGWWFAWHGDEAQRYKLWHPRAHLRARWQAPGEGYVGRTSLVDEYIGDAIHRVAISFEPPPGDGFAVCARISLAGAPVEGGRLEHRVRRVDGGAEMRSRFWLGGAHARVKAGPLTGPVSALARRLARPGVDLGRDLLVHCAQEMTHLASFLPSLHAAVRAGV